MDTYQLTQDEIETIYYAFLFMSKDVPLPLKEQKLMEKLQTMIRQ
jgi:hypothetical protein